MTAFYVFRALFLAFFGEPRGHHHPHESPFVMTGPLMVLAVGSLAGGFLNVPKWLEPLFPAAEGAEEPMLVYISVAAGLLGIGIAYVFYVVNPRLPESLAAGMGGAYKLIYNKYFVDEIYDATLVHPIEAGSRTVLWRGVDAGLIDGIVNGAGRRSRGIGNLLRLLQGGNIRGYAGWVVLGSLLVIIYIGIGGGR